MSDIYENGGFITRYGSSPYDMIECLHIRLALWNDYPSLSSKNFNDIFIKISSNIGKYSFWDSYRSDYGNDIPFKFPSEDCDDPMRFNVIFYIKSDGTVAGYTQFLEIQDTSSVNELWIYTYFKYNSEVSDLILKNSLETHIYENFLGNLDINKSLDDTEFPTRKNIDSIYIETYQRFTNVVNHLLSSDSYSISNNNLVYSKGSAGKLYINEAYIPYPNSSIGRYHDDMVICNWSEYMYKIISLTKVDKYKDPVIYYSGNIRTSTTSDGYGLKDYSISRVSPYCIVCHITTNPSQETAVICLEDSVVRSKVSYEDFVNDPYSARSGCIINNTTMESIDLYDRIPSKEIYKKVTESVNNLEIPGKIVRIESSFIVSKLGSKYYYSNREGVVESDKSDLMVFNDCCLIDQDDSNLYFYFTYNNSRVSTNGSTDDKYKYLIYTIDKGNIRDNLINSIRRNIISYDKIPDIISSYGGILFYRDENKNLMYI